MLLRTKEDKRKRGALCTTGVPSMTAKNFRTTTRTYNRKRRGGDVFREISKNKVGGKRNQGYQQKETERGVLEKKNLEGKSHLNYKRERIEAITEEPWNQREPVNMVRG